MKSMVRMALVASLSLGFVMTDAMVSVAPVHAGKKDKKERREKHKEKKAKAKEKGKDKREKIAKRAMKNTTKLLQRARKVFSKAKQKKDVLYRGALNQRAARNAYRAGRYNQALHLTLVARRKARNVIQANKGELKGADAQDAADETSGAEEAGSAQYLQAVEKENMPQDKLIELVLKSVLN